MQLLAIDLGNAHDGTDLGFIYINPDKVIAVSECWVGHKNQGLRGTRINVQGLNTIETMQCIDEVLAELKAITAK
jgi:hypothetical protein|tara:strand:- start:168 stop:392 length:225 start_codon:yes stop_codon:yes gene_type:complete